MSNPIFPGMPSQASAAASPEQLFGQLGRGRDAVGALWSHQADQLREYHRSHQDTFDVALELPTGSGKTLVGLLIGEWRRRALQQRIVYACPTKQLARQVAAAALRQGVPAVTLIGRHDDWDARDTMKYSRAEAIAITTYSAIFNVRSYLGDSQTLIFDDAHAAEQYVADAWAIRIGKQEPHFRALMDAFGHHVDEQLRTQMVDPETVTTEDVRLLPLSAVAERIAELDQVLSVGLPVDSKFKFSMVRQSLVSCLFFVASAGWYIRPMIPPTFDHDPFTRPTQRIYLSATLGDAGELERAFGRAPIARVPVPEAWERTGSGRRFFVFPQLVDRDASSPSALEEVARLAEKKLILTPDKASAQVMAEFLEIPLADQIEAASSETAVQEFADSPSGTLLAAGRYDGMDLAGETCRLMIMSGAPDASHLQERFLVSKLRATDILAERVRTRLIQGAGRCTRGPQDWSVVVVHGQELLRYFSNRDNTLPLPVELQAEIEYGLLASQTSAENLTSLARSALAKDEAWVDNAEPALSARRAEAVRAQLPTAGELAAVAPLEVNAWTYAWRQDWSRAAETAVASLERLAHPDSRPYRALWAYLASAWFARVGTEAATHRSNDLLRSAHGAAAGSVWLREVAPLPSQFETLDETDQSAVSAVSARLNGPMRSTADFAARIQEMMGGLTQDEATNYERALSSLGEFVGARAFKPVGQGRADSVWIWSGLWIALEAKSEQTADQLSMEYVRKANTQLDSLSADLSESIPEGSASLIIGKTEVVHPDAIAIANKNLFLVHTDVVLDLARAANRAWTSMRASLIGMPLETAGPTIAQMMWGERLLPSQVRERLTRLAIRARAPLN